MKKFISWVFAIGILVLMVSCRETEDLTTLPEASNKNVTTNFRKDSTELKKDSAKVNNEASSTNNQNVVVEEKDPPSKDKFEW